MGIPLLNKIIREKCKMSNSDQNAIRLIKFNEITGKTIVIDTSIYMYKFEYNNALIDNMYQLIMFLKHNNITPIFVFDGIAPPEKQKMLQLRKEQKIIAQKKYNELQKKLIQNQNLKKCIIEDYDEKQEILTEMDSLKKKFIRLNTEKINEVKKLMKLCGAIYYDAEGESDQLCAKLVLENIAYACLSDDMDMFIYGCPRVLRYMSLLNSTFILYDLTKIIKSFGNIPLSDFKQICIFSGTDYNCNNLENINIDLYKTLDLYNKYKNYCSDSKKEYNFGFGFYNWLQENTNYINHDKYNNLIHIFNMFNVDNLNISQYNIENIYNNNNSYICKGPIRELLKKHNFIFI